LGSGKATTLTPSLVPLQVFDPALDGDDCALLKTKGCQVLSSDEADQVRVSPRASPFPGAV